MPGSFPDLNHSAGQEQFDVGIARVQEFLAKDSLAASTALASRMLLVAV